MTEQPTALFKKMIRARSSIGNIQKTGYNKHQNYAYVEDHVLLAKVGGVLQEEGILLTASVVDYTTEERQTKNGSALLTTVTMEFTFIDSETGQQLPVRFVGQGLDSGDKGISKACTNATKSMLLKMFLIPTGEDNGSDTHSDERVSQATQESNPSTNGQLSDEPATEAQQRKYWAVSKPVFEASQDYTDPHER